MSTPDPKTVREIATEHILDDARRAHDIGADVLGHFGPDALTKHEYGAYCSAIREAIATATVTVSWPAEQQPADAVNAEQQQDGAVEAVRNFAEVWRASDEWRRALDAGITDSTFFAVRGVRLTEPQLTAVLAERTALAARVAELESERDLWRTRAYQVGNMFIGERDPEVVPFLGVPGQEPAAAGTEES